MPSPDSTTGSDRQRARCRLYPGAKRAVPVMARSRPATSSASCSTDVAWTAPEASPRPSVTSPSVSSGDSSSVTARASARVVRVHHDDVGLRDLGVGLGQRGVGVDAESAVGVVGEVGQTSDHAGDRDVAHRREGTCAAAPEAGHGTSGAHPGERDPVADPHAGPQRRLGDGDLIGAASRGEAPLDHHGCEPAAGGHRDQRAFTRAEPGWAPDHHLDVGCLLDAWIGRRARRGGQRAPRSA